ncbi:uncharacterized protein LOC134716453 [Mytilus trossulus]|uniref:uncharacterized protein LOC134716453 n=1 Tax=Mytilus trossulus TaxID=6551 RepID=UPI003003CD32
MVYNRLFAIFALAHFLICSFLLLNIFNNKTPTNSPIDYGIDEIPPGLFDDTNDSSKEVQPNMTKVNKRKGEITRKTKMKGNLTFKIVSPKISKVIKLLPTTQIKKDTKRTLIRQDEDDLEQWMSYAIKYCHGYIISYANLFFELSLVVINPRFSHGNKGGEKIESVLNQSEEREYLSLEKGYFQIPCLNCTEISKDTFGKDDPKSRWVNVIQCSNNTNDISLTRCYDFAIALTRFEYANFYHTMTDWFNTFLMAKLFKRTKRNLTILWIDAHPKGMLDTTWKTLFGTIIQTSSLSKPLTAMKLIWGINGYDSLLNQHHLSFIPYIEEFRKFFLKSHGLDVSHKLNCDRVNILVILRHDYIAHPRNPKGKIARKMKNENEILTSLSSLFPSVDVKGVQIDSYSMNKQLELVSKTDILIGVHGAGLSHTLFLPKHAGIIELYPFKVSLRKENFKAFARWRKLTYMSWKNLKEENEDNDVTYVPPNDLTDLVAKMLKKLRSK